MGTGTSTWMGTGTGNDIGTRTHVVIPNRAQGEERWNVLEQSRESTEINVEDEQHTGDADEF